MEGLEVRVADSVAWMGWGDSGCRGGVQCGTGMTRWGELGSGGN